MNLRCFRILRVVKNTMVIVYKSSKSPKDRLTWPNSMGGPIRSPLTNKSLGWCSSFRSHNPQKRCFFLIRISLKKAGSVLKCFKMKVLFSSLKNRPGSQAKPKNSFSPGVFFHLRRLWPSKTKSNSKLMWRSVKLRPRCGDVGGWVEDGWPLLQPMANRLTF